MRAAPWSVTKRLASGEHLIRLQQSPGKAGRPQSDYPHEQDFLQDYETCRTVYTRFVCLPLSIAAFQWSPIREIG